MHTGAFRGTEVPGWFQPTFAVIAVMAALPIQAQTLNRNLVVNGGAENGAAVQAIGDPQVGQVPGWTVTGPFSVGTYDVSEFPSSTDYGPTDRGAKLFYGGSGTDHSYATQLIDLSGASSEIDGGKVKFYFSGYIGSGGAVPANIQQAFLKAEFLNGSGVTLLTAVAPGPKFEEDDGVSNMMLREITGFLPPNIRTVRVTVDLATADSGSYNTLAADNISLVLATESLYGVNLLVNGDAETNPDQIDFANDKPVAGWNVHSQITVGTWGDYNFPSATDPGPPDRGQYFFICWGDRAADNRAYQFVDISAAKQMIDSGQVSYKLSGWFGSGQDGDTDSPDNADLQVAFYDASGNGLPGLQVGPVTAQDRNGQIGMFQRSGSGTVPVGARLARIDLNFNRLTQDVTINTNAYADSLSFVLTNATPPSIGGIISLGDFGALPNFTSGSLIEIYGSNLATSRRKWSGADFNGSNAPTSLDGTSVTVNNKSAFVAFISPEQVNV